MKDENCLVVTFFIEQCTESVEIYFSTNLKDLRFKLIK